MPIGPGVVLLLLKINTYQEDGRYNYSVVKVKKAIAPIVNTLDLNPMLIGNLIMLMREKELVSSLRRRRSVFDEWKR